MEFGMKGMEIMKKWFVTAAVVLSSIAGSWAAEQRFVMTLRGTVETPTGKTILTESSLLTAPYNRFILVLDPVAQTVAIEEWGPGASGKIDRDPVLSGVQGLMENFRMAYFGGAKPRFMANLEMVDMDWDRDGVEDTDGNMQMDAKLMVNRATGRITKVSANLIGVLNDPVNGAGRGTAKHFRGKITTVGAPF